LATCEGWGGTCIQICPIGAALLSCPLIRPRTTTVPCCRATTCHAATCRAPYSCRDPTYPKDARVDKEPRLRARETVQRADTEQDLVSLARAAIAASDTSVPLAAMDVGLFLGVTRRWSLLLQPGGGQLPRCWPDSVSRISDLGPGPGVTGRTGRQGHNGIFRLSYSLGSIPSGTGRLYCQDVARGATNRSRGSEVQDLQPTGARRASRVGFHPWVPAGTAEPP